MQQPRFKIVFSGQLVPGAALDETREKLANLFKSSIEQIDALFKGDKVILKRNLEEAEADKYLAVLTRAGALASKEADTSQGFSLVKIDEEPVASGAAQMRCPKCGHDQDKAPICAACGIVVEKFLARQASQAEATPAPGSPATVEVSPYTPPKAQVAAPAAEFGELKVFGVTGRIGRVRYLGWSAVLFTATFGLYIVAALLGLAAAWLAGLLFIPIIIACGVVSVQIGVQRLHDMGMSGWLWLLTLVPFVGAIFAIVMLVVPGTEGPNRYGPPPPPNSTAVKVLAFGWLLIPVVIGILAAIAMPAYQDYLERAQQYQQQSQ
ncbi:DUF805 domain-containing protein [Pseudomonas sp. LRF_L74]|uniref:DUF805 domain-containing protein n=1 Tax=Pseudomonas sp. LRF_L74 TaxID=3369422 RepID=UPI003F626619